MNINQSEFSETCQVFINTVNHYFSHITGIESETQIPYIKSKEELEFKDYTGMISISGSKRGYIFVTGERQLYIDLIKQFLGVEPDNEDDILDMAGELSNVISGNMREEFGGKFMISVPVVFKGNSVKIPESKSITSFVIPVIWKDNKASLIIGLE